MNRLIIAGIGNIWRYDDGFGVEVVRRLSLKNWPKEIQKEIQIVDFGIRGIDLVYALMENHHHHLLFIDVVQRQKEPGALFFLRLDPDDSDPASTHTWDPHRMDPWQVLRLLKTSGYHLQNLYLLGCEPLILGSDEDM